MKTVEINPTELKRLLAALLQHNQVQDERIVELEEKVRVLNAKTAGIREPQAWGRVE